MPSHESLREALTEEILYLQETQVIDELYTKWWKKELDGGKCAEAETTPAGKAAELGVENVGGVFVVLMGGVVGGFFISLCEFIWKARKNARRDKVRRVLSRGAHVSFYATSKAGIITGLNRQSLVVQTSEERSR